VDSCIGVWTFSPNLWFRICNMGFLQHIQVKILPENLSQNKAEEENEKKTKDLREISCYVDSFTGVWAFRPIFF
jgi:hypothetical protein